MINFPHLATRLFNVPLAIRREKAEIVMAALADRLGVAHLFRSNGTAVALDPAVLDPAGAAPSRAYDVVAGAALIPVQGTLVQRLGMLQAYSGMSGYDGIRCGFLQAMADPGVDGIVLDVDSPGGEVAGCFDLVDTIHAARGIKPIVAILNENACSAAYAIASAADSITVPRTGFTGSIGVICMHVDFSQALAKDGVTVRIFAYGDRKADGNDVQPLSDPAAAAIQADMATMGELFIETVARNRGITAKAVRDMQAATYLGAAGVAAGLADRVAAPDDAFNAFIARL